MIRFLRRRTVYLIALGLGIVMFLYTLPILSQLRDRFVYEFFKHKEFMFYLKNAKAPSKKHLGEEEVINLLKRYRITPEKIQKTETGYEVEIKELSWSLFPYLIKDFEKNFRILTLSAVDNTGKGLFKVRVVLGQ